jgi:fibronectin type 3 domain-containing protein
MRNVEEAMSRDLTSRLADRIIPLLMAFGFISIATFTPQPLPAQTTGLVAAYSFNEGTGTTVTDLSGNNNTGTISGATWTTGKYGGALRFNGSNNYIDLANPTSLRLTGSMTLSAWILAMANPPDDGQIIAKSNSSAGWQLKTSPDTGPHTFGIAISASSNSHVQRYSNTVRALNTWYHVAGVYNATARTLDIYVNGVLDDGVLSGTVPASQYNSSVNTNIGRRSGGFYFNGIIDEVRIYNRALSQTEIQADMNTPLGVSGPDTQPPTAPSNLTASAISGSQINLSWTASTDNIAVTGYVVERCQGTGCTTFSQIATPTTTTFSDSTLTAGVSYSYRVRATDAASNLSPYSNVATTTTPAPDTQPPTAPANLTATAASGTQINLSWTASTDNTGVTSYRVERCQGTGCTSFVQIATSTTTAFSDSGLTAGTSYSYQVRATDAAGNLSPYSNVATATTTAPDTQPPTAPTNLTATATGAGQINLSWTASTDNTGVTGYRVERCQGVGCTTFTQVATPTTTTFSDSGLAANASYTYQVRAADAAGNLSSYSNTATATTLATISGLVAAYSFNEGTGVTVTDSSGNGLTGTISGATWTTAGKYGNALSFNGTSSYVDLGNPTALQLTGSMTWSAWINAAANPPDDGQIVAKSDGSSGWQFKTSPDTGTHTFGVAVSNSSGSPVQRYSAITRSLNTWYHVAGVYNATAGTLDIYVNGVLNNGVLSGTVPASQLNSAVNANIGRRTGGFYFNGIIDEVRIYNRALSQAEIQTDMNTPIGATSDTQPPTAPTNLSANPISVSEIDLNWTASTDNTGVTGYLVEICQGAGCSNFTQIGTTTSTTFSSTSLTAGTSYSYRIRATDAAGNLSNYSSIATAVTQAVDTTPPTAPSNLTATATSSSQITLTWTASTDAGGLHGYSIERCLTSSCVFTVIVPYITSTVYNDTGLTAGTSYSYRVQASDSAGNLSAYSNIATASTPASDTQPPTTPTNLTATASGSTQINLSWTASTDNTAVTAYLLERCQGAGCSTFTQIASTGSVTYSDTGLTAGSSYTYRVRATDAAGNLSGYSSTATTSTSAVNPGLISAYGFSEGSGTTTADSSGNGLTGTIQGATWTTSGRNGNALVFNGTTSYVDLGTMSAFPLTSSATWSAWVFPTGNPPDDGQIIAKSGNSDGWQLKTTPDTGVRTFGVAVSNGTSNTQRYSQTVLSLNTWYHVAGVYNATSQTLDIYVNGVLDNGTLSGTVPASQNNPASINANIGRRQGGYYFIGTIDDVRVYNRALSQAEIQADMNTPVGSAPAGPAVSLSSTTISFGSQPTGTPSTAQPVTLTNSGSQSLTISNIAVTGTNAGDFSQTNNCPASLAPLVNCTINITFTPTTTGTRSAAVTITDNAPTSPQSISLTGTGTGFSVSPKVTVLTSTLTQQFTVLNGSGTVTWLVDNVVGGSATSGTITPTGLYTPPAAAGTHTVTANTSTSQTASATVYISNYPGTFTMHNDNFRTGVNSNETVLAPANVNSTQFGKLFSYSTDGISHASPLYVANVNIPGIGFRNVVYVATEHDSVYAFDADGRNTTPFWQVSFINPAAGITTVPPADTGETGDINPEIGITGTPVIDIASNTIYVVAKTKEVSGGSTNYRHRLHALDLSTGAEKFGGPVILQASVSGTGAGSSGGVLQFNSLRHNQRPALLLNNGVIYIAFASHGDQAPYHGWVLGYSATTLQQTMAWCDSPNGSQSGIWLSGMGPTADSAGNIYFTTANGSFNANTGGTEYGDSFIKLSPSGTVIDYFTSKDQSVMNSNNWDLASTGAMLLPDQPGSHPHLLVSAGKNGTIYLVDRDNMGHFSNNDSGVVQSLSNIFPNGTPEPGNYSAPVYFNGTVYFGPINDRLQAFQLANGLLSTAPTSTSSAIYPYPGATLSASSNGTTNGILWAIQRNDSAVAEPSSNPATLRAYSTSNLSTELYNSTQAGARDALTATAKFTVPLVANGRVYVLTQNQLTAFGLLP